MDPQDLEILRLLQRDATLTMQDIALMTASSQSTVWRRVQALEAAGILTHRVALVDPAKSGLGTTALVDIHLRAHTPENRQAFERFVANAPEIMEAYSVSGQSDYRLLIRVAAIADYERFLMDHLLANPAVASASTAIVLRHIKYTTALPL